MATIINFLTTSGILIIILIAILSSAIKIVQEYERGV
ncbi:MAG TPA: slipin family protein, partial [Anaerolineae bacterium]|nr:slipin family protein [Anaerolineae bacterium]